MNIAIQDSNQHLPQTTHQQKTTTKTPKQQMSQQQQQQPETTEQQDHQQQQQHDNSTNNTSTPQQQQQQQPEIELVTYMCGGNLFEVPKRYQVKGVLGQGAYGVVVSARDTETDTDVAIKKIFNIFEHDKEYQKRILREGLLWWYNVVQFLVFL